METDEEARMVHLRSLCGNACNPELDGELRLELQKRVTKELTDMPMGQLRELAATEKDVSLRRAAGMIYAWRIANETMLDPNKARLLGKFIEIEGTSEEVRRYVTKTLLPVLGWPKEKWDILVDSGKPVEERIAAGKDVIEYCYRNAYVSTLYRIASDESMPMKVREDAGIAIIDSASAKSWPDEPKIELNLMPRRVAERMGREWGPAARESVECIMPRMDASDGVYRAFLRRREIAKAGVPAEGKERAAPQGNGGCAKVFK
ncbi:MAG: hypothetical protein WC350_05320 [Candidatus Micrarchaeia archaeon]|jgi:hypothetical protein